MSRPVSPKPSSGSRGPFGFLGSPKNTTRTGSKDSPGLTRAASAGVRPKSGVRSSKNTGKDGT
eukprot:2518264-Pyramimonas_sp.AAC.1